MKSKIIILISICEIIGGILGILLQIEAVLKIINSSLTTYLKMYNLLFVIFMLILYAMTTIAGILLCKKKQKGIILSIIVQAFQIPYISMIKISYSFIAGLQFGIAIKIFSTGPKIALLYHLGSSYLYGLNIGYSQYTVLGVNFIPIIVISYLRKAHKIMKNNKFEEKNKAINITDDLLKSQE